MSRCIDLVPISSSFACNNWNHLNPCIDLVPILHAFAGAHWSHFEGVPPSGSIFASFPGLHMEPFRGGYPVWIHFCFLFRPAHGAIPRGYPCLDPFLLPFPACAWSHSEGVPLFGSISLFLPVRKMASVYGGAFKSPVLLQVFKVTFYCRVLL